MPETLFYTGELVVTTCWCGIPHAVPSELYNKQLREWRDGKKQTGIFCPLGHSWIKSGTGEAEKLRKQLAAEQARHDQTKAERDYLERSRSAIKGQVTKIKNRVGAGVCPCCNRQFADLYQHMRNKHPDFAEQEINVVAPTN